MIKITRTDCPEILRIGIAEESDGEFETKDSIVFFSAAANHDLPYKRIRKNSTTRTKSSYSTYKDKSIRKKLALMFHNKCAYCESKITISTGDVEHFRPKAGYGENEPITTPGYYWLASDWENLLFACPFCNQTNTIEVLEDGTTKEVTVGKLSKFPLETENHRLKKEHGQIFLSDKAAYNELFNLEETERLLLNPCIDNNVEAHFKYLDEGVVLPNDGLNDLENKRAKTSIDVYALKRTILIQTRQEKIIEIKAQITRVEQAIFNINAHVNSDFATKQRYDNIFKTELSILNNMKKDEKEFAGMARYVIQKYLPPASYQNLP